MRLISSIVFILALVLAIVGLRTRDQAKNVAPKQGRLLSPCGQYTLEVIRVAGPEARGTWAFMQKGQEQALFKGLWTGGLSIVWSKDCGHAALNVAWGSKLSDSELYDFAGKRVTTLSSKVKPDLPPRAEILHRYDRALRWTKDGQLSLRSRGDYVLPGDGKLRRFDEKWLIRTDGAGEKP